MQLSQTQLMMASWSSSSNMSAFGNRAMDASSGMNALGSAVGFDETMQKYGANDNCSCDTSFLNRIGNSFSGMGNSLSNLGAMGGMEALDFMTGKIEDMMQDMEGTTTNMLFSMSYQSSTTLTSSSMVGPVAGDPLYPVPAGTKAAIVDPKYSADAVSTRIVQFATFAVFSNAKPEDYEKTIKEVTEAMEAGFIAANQVIGEVPADLGQLFNDTYHQTQDKWRNQMDKLFSMLAPKEGKESLV